MKEKAIALAEELLREAQKLETPEEKKRETLLHQMINSAKGRAFSTAVTDQCFRSKNWVRGADQLTFLLQMWGMPTFLPFFKRLELQAFFYVGRYFPKLSMPLIRKAIRKETSEVVVPGESELLHRHLEKRKKEKVHINLNRIGEAILGEKEAQHRLGINLKDLSSPEIDYISVKVSTLFSQMNLLGWEKTLSILSERLRILYRTGKFINLDMEEYRDLLITVELFRRVLSEPEFINTSAGIVLQSYLPDSFPIQQQLTQWAQERIKKGGSPIKIRLVKGANLAMEKLEANLRGWPQTPYPTKAEVDANYLRMIDYGCQLENAKAAHVGIGSHNLFDIAYALILRKERGIKPFVTFEMLEGMADPIRKAVQNRAGDMLLYMPVVTEEEFPSAIAYLVRRLDENTSPENFLKVLFDLQPNSQEWQKQAQLFSDAFDLNPSTIPRRTQNRLEKPTLPNKETPFENESDTDWSLPNNRLWGEKIAKEWSQKKLTPRPKADEAQMQIALENSSEAFQQWSKKSVAERSDLLFAIANALRCNRDILVGAMMANTYKTIQEADIEVSEAIDFAEYYRRQLEEAYQIKNIGWKAKGTILIAPPWNFPCSISSGGILAALAAGNCVLFKPAPEAVEVGWELIQIFWEAGVSQKVLQFLHCDEEPIGTQSIKDPRVAAVVLTGSTATAKHFMKLRPGLDLIAETGGKNAMIITAMADRDLAIKDLIQSAFGYAGQKCSACSLAILEEEVYEDLKFRRTLQDAVESLPVGVHWDLFNKVNPLIREPNPVLLRGLTTLEEGEEWLVQPTIHSSFPHLWSPGVKWGVQPGSFTHQNELFGPVLGVMKAKNLSHAVDLANQTPYGLTAGLHSLDEREQKFWIEHIVAGNCYINRGITGAIVRRQPFGGCKASSFGPGGKAGGPNYVLQLMTPINGSDEMDYQEIWDSYFSQDHDPSNIPGQHNIFRYVPQKAVVRIQPLDKSEDIQKIKLAAKICNSPLEIIESSLSDEELIKRIQKGIYSRMRFLSKPSIQVRGALVTAGITNYVAPVSNSGRIELLHYLREVSLSIDYHRYGFIQDHF